jgi:hypothetical protein
MMCVKFVSGLAIVTAAMSALCPAMAQSARATVEGAIAWVREEARPSRVGLATFWDGNKYVQCRGVKDSELRCEAAGALMQVSLARVLTPGRVERLTARGWVLDPSFGNYVRTFNTNVPTVVVADEILAALQQGYNADLAKLDVRRQSIADVPCPPRAGPSQSLAGAINVSPRMAPALIFDCAYRRTAQEPVEILPPGSTAADLIRVYGPRLTSEIRRLRANKHLRVYAVFDAGLGYVQCQPVRDPDGFYCEAQSADSFPGLATVLTPERIARLRAAGFEDPGRAPNYSKIYVGDQIDDAGLASELLTLLHEAYGYYGANKLEVKTERPPRR